MPWITPPGAGATVQIWNGYSLAERDRRWQAVRANAADAGFDCVLIPLGNGVDGRYMTQLRCSAMVLPSDGRAPIVIADRRSSNEWIPEPWQTGRQWAEPMGEALLDLGMQRAKIGVVGLKGGSMTHCSSVDGVVNHTAFEYVLSKLPNASFEDATDIVGAVRYVKSGEEIDSLRRSAAAAASGVKEIIKLARPGVDAGVFYADVMQRILELRSEYFPLVLSIDAIDAPKRRRYANPPLGRHLEQNALIDSEVNAVIGAELTQVCQPVLLGSVPESWKPVIDVQNDVYQAGLETIKPGVSIGTLIDKMNIIGSKRGMRVLIRMHGCGYGDDGPVLHENSISRRARDLNIKKGNAFVWKPAVATHDGRIQFSWGGPILVAEHSAEPLFQRSHGLVAIT
jgi:Xaa-Pro aminopeptidase